MKTKKPTKVQRALRREAHYFGKWGWLTADSKITAIRLDDRDVMIAGVPTGVLVRALRARGLCK